MANKGYINRIFLYIICYHFSLCKVPYFFIILTFNAIPLFGTQPIVRKHTFK